jgi:hypothetical protein
VCEDVSFEVMIWSDLKKPVKYFAHLYYLSLVLDSFPNTFNHQKDFIMTTMAIVLITVYIMGGTTEAALNALKIPTGVDEDQYMAERLREPVIPNAVRNFGENDVDKCRALD